MLVYLEPGLLINSCVPFIFLCRTRTTFLEVCKNFGRKHVSYSSDAAGVERTRSSMCSNTTRLYGFIYGNSWVCMQTLVLIMRGCLLMWEILLVLLSFGLARNLNKINYPKCSISYAFINTDIQQAYFQRLTLLSSKQWKHIQVQRI